jgi:hypothetical protein
MANVGRKSHLYLADCSEGSAGSPNLSFCSMGLFCRVQARLTACLHAGPCQAGCSRVQARLTASSPPPTPCPASPPTASPGQSSPEWWLASVIIICYRNCVSRFRWPLCYVFTYLEMSEDGELYLSHFLYGLTFSKGSSLISYFHFFTLLLLCCHWSNSCRINILIKKILLQRRRMHHSYEKSGKDLKIKTIISSFSFIFYLWSRRPFPYMYVW